MLPLLLADLAKQSLPAAEILVVDDASSDGTAAVAAAAGATVVRTTGPPAGWAGKPWACWRGVQSTTAPMLVFLDADVRLAPDALARLVATHDRVGGLLSVQPRHLAGRAVEGLSMVPNVVVLAGTGAFSPRPSRANRGVRPVPGVPARRLPRRRRTPGRARRRGRGRRVGAAVPRRREPGHLARRRIGGDVPHVSPRPAPADRRLEQEPGDRRRLGAAPRRGPHDALGRRPAGHAGVGRAAGFHRLVAGGTGRRSRCSARWAGRRGAPDASVSGRWCCSPLPRQHSSSCSPGRSSASTFCAPSRGAAAGWQWSGSHDVVDLDDGGDRRGGVVRDPGGQRLRRPPAVR